MAWNEPVEEEVDCPKCGKECKVMAFQGRSYTTREAGSTGISAPVTRGVPNRVLGECECGYKFKPRDLED